MSQAPINAPGFTASQHDLIAQQVRRERRRAVDFSRAGAVDGLRREGQRQEEARGGVCASMCLTWLQRIMTSRSQAGVQRLADIRADLPGIMAGQQQIMAAQQALLRAIPMAHWDRLQGEVNAEASGERATALGLGEGALLENWQSCNDVAVVAAAVVRHRGQGITLDHKYVVVDPVGVRRPEINLPAYHTVALYCAWNDADRHYLYDPNVGERVINTADLANGLRGWLTDSARHVFQDEDFAAGWRLAIDHFSLTGYHVRRRR